MSKISWHQYCYLPRLGRCRTRTSAIRAGLAVEVYDERRVVLCGEEVVHLFDPLRQLIVLPGGQVLCHGLDSCETKAQNKREEEGV